MQVKEHILRGYGWTWFYFWQFCRPTQRPPICDPWIWLCIWQFCRPTQRLPWPTIPDFDYLSDSSVDLRKDHLVLRYLNLAMFGYLSAWYDFLFVCSCIWQFCKPTQRYSSDKSHKIVYVDVHIYGSSLDLRKYMLATRFNSVFIYVSYRHLKAL